MTEPFDHEAPANQPPPATGVSQPPPAVAWVEASSAGETPGTTGSRRLMDLIVWVVALAALVVLSLGRAGLSGATGSERIAYALGSATGALLIATAVRWLWLRFRRRNDATKRLLSPWIAIGAVVFAALTIGSARS